MKRTIVIFGMSLSMLGCIPVPHTVPVTPVTKGYLHNNDTPIANAKLTLSKTKDCSDNIDAVLSDISGRFEFKETTNFHWYAGLKEHRSNAWSICLAFPNGDVINIYDGSAYSMKGANIAEELDCDINKDSGRSRPCLPLHVVKPDKFPE